MVERVVGIEAECTEGMARRLVERQQLRLRYLNASRNSSCSAFSRRRAAAAVVIAPAAFSRAETLCRFATIYRQHREKAGAELAGWRW